MDSLRQGHKELLEELTKICSRIDTKVGAELDSDNFTPVSKDELRFLREQDGRIKRLMDENSRLAREWAEDRDKSLRIEVEQAKRLEKALKQAEAGGNVCEPDSTMKDKYDSLVVKFNKLYENHKHIKEANADLAAKFREQRRLAKSWRAYAELEVHNEKDAWIRRQQERIQALQAILKTHGITDDAVVAVPPPGERSHHSSSTEDDIAPTSPGNLGPAPDAPKETYSRPFDQLSSSPEVVSSRLLKKRKSTKDAERSGDVKVKVETISSSPVGLAALKCLDHGQSIDLDQIGQKVNTPKKRRRGVEPPRQNSKFSNESQLSGRSSSQSQHATFDDPLTGPEIMISKEEPRDADTPLQSVDPNRRFLPWALAMDASNKRRRVISDKAIESVGEDGHNIPPSEKEILENTTNSIDRLEGLLGQPFPGRSILEPTHLDRSYTSRGADSPVGTKTSSTSKIARYMEVDPSEAEQGPSRLENQSLYRSRQEPTNKGAGSNSVTPARSSLNATSRSVGEPSRSTGKFTEVSRPTDNKTGIAIGSTAAIPKSAASNSVGKIYKSPYPPARGSVVPSRSSVSWHRGSGGGEEDPSLDDTPENEPLRCRELRMLGPQDFKINPAYNQGYNYAFTDVVRNRYERQCLQSCTKPGCCGKQFRALAVMFFDRAIAANPSQREADEKLAKDFLGGNAHKFQSMSKDEKHEILVQAKTRELANQFGRHRHAYERPKSPPGFWDADFPTTQEQVAQREKAHEFERELVARRYEEAMRPGGAYLFRDE